MKSILIAASLLLTSPIFAQGRLGDVPPPTGRYTNYIDTVPLGKATREKLNNFYLSVAATWEDGSEYRPIIFLHLELPKGTDESSALNPEALIDGATLAKEPVRFYLHAKSPGENPQEFKVREISWRGTSIHLKTGSIETEVPKQKVARAPSPSANTPIEVRSSEASEVPSRLTDYTTHNNVGWAIREEGTDDITLFCSSSEYSIVRAEKVGVRSIKLFVQKTNATPKRPQEEVPLTFAHNVNPKRIRLTPVRGESTLHNAVSKLIRDVKDGDLPAPMMAKSLVATR